LNFCKGNLPANLDFLVMRLKRNRLGSVCRAILFPSCRNAVSNWQWIVVRPTRALARHLAIAPWSPTFALAVPSGHRGSCEAADSLQLSPFLGAFHGGARADYVGLRPTSGLWAGDLKVAIARPI